MLSVLFCLFAMQILRAMVAVVGVNGRFPPIHQPAVEERIFVQQFGHSVIVANLFAVYKGWRITLDFCHRPHPNPLPSGEGWGEGKTPKLSLLKKLGFLPKMTELTRLKTEFLSIR